MSNIETTIDLEDLLTGEPKCQSLHRDRRDAVCSMVVTHLGFRDCNSGVVKFLCQSSANFAERMRNGGNICSDCKRPCSSHWFVRPI